MSKQTSINDRIINPPIRKVLNLGIKRYYAVTNFVGKMPHPVRWCYWSMLYYYNVIRFPKSLITLKLYQSYAKRNQ